MLDARVRPIHIHADAGADQNTHHWVRYRTMKARAHTHRHRLAAPDGFRGLAACVENLDPQDLARSIPVAKARPQPFLFSFGRLLFEHQTDIAIDDILRLALSFD